MSAEHIRLNRAIQAELRVLVSQGLLDEATFSKVAARYPVTPWDVARLVRWFTVLGAVTAGLGLLLLIGTHCYDYIARALSFIWTHISPYVLGMLDFMRLHLNPYVAAEVTLCFASVGTFLLGRYLKLRRNLAATGAAVELFACFLVTALTFTFGAHFSTGSGNWPALTGIDAAAFFVLAYALRNNQVLIYAVINLFVFFGGETGYVSGWGVYWLGMNYPLRFLLIGMLSVVASLLHSHGKIAALRPYAFFSRVYGHFGYLSVNLALWFFAVFGYFNGHISFSDNVQERLLFSLLWGLCSAGSIYLGLTADMSIPRSYGLVFLIINLYTFYFQFVLANSYALWWLHMLLIGGSMLALGFRIERVKALLRQRSAGSAAQPEAAPAVTARVKAEAGEAQPSSEPAQPVEPGPSGP